MRARARLLRFFGTTLKTHLIKTGGGGGSKNLKNTEASEDYSHMKSNKQYVERLSQGDVLVRRIDFQL